MYVSSSTTDAVDYMLITLVKGVWVSFQRRLSRCPPRRRCYAPCRVLPGTLYYKLLPSRLIHQLRAYRSQMDLLGQVVAPYVAKADSIWARYSI